ncbi:MAG: ROK family protein [Bacteroidales bacterium]
MPVIGIDLGGTKLSSAIVDEAGEIISRSLSPIIKRKGHEAGRLVKDEAGKLMNEAKGAGISISGIGISVPGIYNPSTGRVWAPNISGWDDYPLLDEAQALFKDIRVVIDSDRTCYILGEAWKGAARGSSNAIYLSIGTGIGAGILCNGNIIQGQSGIAGAIGWMGLTDSYKQEYKNCGCFEYHASGSGMVRKYNDLITDLNKGGTGSNRTKKGAGNNINVSGAGSTRHEPGEGYRSVISSAVELFEALERDDQYAVEVVKEAIDMWGKAAANLVSLFNPEIIVFGGGIFGPAAKFMPQISNEAQKWAQPLSMAQVKLAISLLGGDAGLYGAARLALMKTD